MTRKHFKLLAEALAFERPIAEAAGYVQWLNDRNAVANVCARLNPNFNRSKFIDACMAE